MDEKGKTSAASAGYDRDRFERWISGPPFESGVTRKPNNHNVTAWSGNYQDYNVQFAWESWQEALRSYGHPVSTDDRGVKTMKKLFLAAYCIGLLSSCANYLVLEPISQQARNINDSMGVYSSAQFHKFQTYSTAQKWQGIGDILHGLTGGRQ